jgi:hypothetical protein
MPALTIVDCVYKMREEFKKADKNNNVIEYWQNEIEKIDLRLRIQDCTRNIHNAESSGKTGESIESVILFMKDSLAKTKSDYKRLEAKTFKLPGILDYSTNILLLLRLYNTIWYI